MDRMQIILEAVREKGWCELRDFLSAQELQLISDYIQEHRSSFKPALVGKGQERKRVEEIRGDFTHWLDPLDPPAPFAGIVKFLEELKLELNRHFFLGLKEFECHLAAYPPGSFYKKHSDRFEADSSRSFTFLFYVHPEWEENDGGELVLYNNEETEVARVTPWPGSFVCFISADFPHEVLPAKRERQSFTGWMHTKIIN